MKIGDLVRLSSGFGDQNLRGIILDIYEDPEEEYEAMLSVFWTDGDKTEEFYEDLEVVS